MGRGMSDTYEMPTTSSSSRMSIVVAQNTALTFVGYFAIGLEAAIVPIYVDNGLGLGATLAGVALSAQPLATLASRWSAGGFTDRFGPRLTVLRGILLIALSGLLFSVAALPVLPNRSLHFAVLLLSRLVLGWGISWISAAGAVWAIGRAGDEHASKIFVWNGVATYGSFALGAPLGLWCGTHWGSSSLGLGITILCLVAAGLTYAIKDISRTEMLPLHLLTVLRRVAPYGSVLAFATCGYGVFAAFVSLFFRSQTWRNAALPLTLYGASTVIVRLLLGRWIDRYSVFRVGMVSIAVELSGLALLATSNSPHMALVASCLLGAGFSLVFPALCVPTIRSVGVRDRASAISVYTAFMEVSLAITAPLAGILVTHSGYRPTFWAAFLVVFAGFTCLVWAFRRSTAVPLTN
jgi:predicted MFS family arabinose efflux permease